MLHVYVNGYTVNVLVRVIVYVPVCNILHCITPFLRMYHSLFRTRLDSKFVLEWKSES